jgi:hypothetical protein
MRFRGRSKATATRPPGAVALVAAPQNGKENGAPAMVAASGPLQKLALAAEGVRRKRTDRDVRKIMQFIGMLAVGLGFMCIGLGWYGVSHSPYVFEQVPFVISGGILGLGLIVGGGVLIRCAWSLRQIEETRRSMEEARRNASAIVQSVSRLEDVLRTLSDKLQANDLHQPETGSGN